MADIARLLVERHCVSWAADRRYRWSWYVFPQTLALIAIAASVGGGSAPIPQAAWARVHLQSGSEMTALRDSARLDPVSALNLLHVAEAGEPVAQFMYGTLFDPTLPANTAEQRDGALAREWYRKSAEHGVEEAQFNDGFSFFSDRFPLPREPEKGYPWLLKVAVRGNAKAQYYMGAALKLGQGVARDPKASADWFRKSADAGLPAAQAALGDDYLAGDGVGADPDAALGWFRKAADQKWVYAARRAGILLLGGGVTRDADAALKYLTFSAQAGDREAQYALASMYRDGSGVPKDQIAAIEWYRKSANQGLADAQNAIGMAYLLGAGVPRDEAIGREWLEKAKAGGNPAAAQHLGAMGAH